MGALTTIATSQFGAQDLALGKTHVYWTDHDGDEVAACAPDGGCGTSPPIFSSGDDTPTGITTDGTNVYWTDYGSDVADGRIRVRPQL